MCRCGVAASLLLSYPQVIFALHSLATQGESQVRCARSAYSGSVPRATIWGPFGHSKITPDK